MSAVNDWMDPLYRRVEHGKRVRYEPVGDRHVYDALAPGSYVVVVDERGSSSCRSIDPPFAALEAGLHIVQDAMVKRLQEANTAKPDPRIHANTEVMQRAWDAYVQIAGPTSMIQLTGASMLDIVEAGVEVLRQHMKEEDHGEEG